MKPFYLWWKTKTKKTITTTTKTATSFHQSMPVWIKQIIACKPLSAAVCCFKESFTIKWKKSCQTNNQHLYSRIFVWKIQIVLNINSYFLWRGDFVEDILFELKIKKLPHRFTHRLFVCLFLSEDSASGFQFNSFWLVTCYFPESSDAQVIRGCFAFQKPVGRRLFASHHPLPP